MNEKMKIAIITNHFNFNGISTIILNYLKYIDLNKFDITIISGIPIVDYYRKSLNNIGIKFIDLPSRNNEFINYYKSLFKILSKDKFDAVHINGNSSSMALELLIAYLKGIKIRISHCHNQNCSNKFIHTSLLPFFNTFCNGRLACSDSAGKWLYKNKNFKILFNAFEIDKFKYNENYRNQIRKKLKIDDNTFLLGHIGRFNNQKNQEYLLDVLEKIDYKKYRIKICFVGDGFKKNEFINMAKKRKLEDKIIFYGESEYVYKIYSAFDLFVFPSKYEGFGNVMVEAQINGLYCIASTNVPKDTKITNNVKFLPIESENQYQWRNEILKKCKNKKDRNILNIDSKKIKKYDIKKQVNNLEKFYLEKFNK